MDGGFALGLCAGGAVTNGLTIAASKVALWVNNKAARERTSNRRTRGGQTFCIVVSIDWSWIW